MSCDVTSDENLDFLAIVFDDRIAERIVGFFFVFKALLNESFF